ncbi:MAG TPA: uroporphyrinogen-III synthase [Acidimicrobiia bacterium]
MKRVAVTTDRFDLAAPWFAANGLEPVPLPCVRVDIASEEVLDEARTAAARADLLVVTSPRTVDLLWRGRGMPPVPVAAVGEATAAAVEDVGGRVRFVGSAGLAGLVSELAKEEPLGRIVFPRAANSDPVPLEQLRGEGTDVVPIDVYRTVPIAPGRDAVHAVAFASPSAVEGWLLSRPLDGLVIGAIGHTTASALTGHRPVIVPYRPSHRALAEALAQFMEVPA